MSIPAAIWMAFLVGATTSTSTPGVREISLSQALAELDRQNLTLAQAQDRARA